MDEALEKAFRKAVKEEGQSNIVADRLIAWFEELAREPEMDRDRANDFLVNVMEQLRIIDTEKGDLSDED